MTTLYANPYSLDATGFYFDSFEDYEAKATTARDRFGNKVEEFEIDYIDGDNPALFAAVGVNQATLGRWFEQLDDIDDGSDEAIAISYLVEVIGMPLEQALEQYEGVQVWHGTATDYAAEIIEETTEIPQHLGAYIDYEAIARDMALNGEIYEVGRETIIINALDF